MLRARESVGKDWERSKAGNPIQVSGLIMKFPASAAQNRCSNGGVLDKERNQRQLRQVVTERLVFMTSKLELSNLMFNVNLNICCSSCHKTQLIK